MNQYIPDNKIFRTSIALAVLSAIGMLGAAGFVYQRISSLNAEIGKTQEMSGSVEQAFKIKGRLNELEDETKILDAFFVSNDKEVVFIESIENLASTSGIKLEIKSISVDAKSNTKNFKEDLLISMEGEGSRLAMLAFLKKLESMPKAISVKMFSARSEAESWRISLTIAAARLK